MDSVIRTFGKCPFLKIRRKYREIIEDSFKDCLGFDCMSFRYNKTNNGIEAIDCRRLEKEK